LSVALLVDSSRHQKWAIFCITQRLSNLLADTKDRLPADTKNYFCSTELMSPIFLVDSIFY
jgi:hypothetical protein